MLAGSNPGFEIKADSRADSSFCSKRLRLSLMEGSRTSSLSELNHAVVLSNNSAISLAMLGHAYAASGNKKEADKMSEKLAERSKHQYVPSYWMAMLRIGFGDKDESFIWLERAFQERSSWLVWAGVEPRFDTLRSDPRFASLMAKMKLKPQKDTGLGIRGWLKGPSI